MSASLEARNSAATVVAAGAAEPAQYLTFMLAQEQFAIGILNIKEIIEYHGVTEVPMMPQCVRGVINLRGAVVPVMDLLARFGRPASGVTKRTCVVIVEVENGDERQVIGLVVDAVNEVLDIAAADIEPAPSFGAASAPSSSRASARCEAGSSCSSMSIARCRSTRSPRSPPIRRQSSKKPFCTETTR